MPSSNVQFAEAAKEWDLETLYTDLASAKGKRLTPVEKLHLRGLLCGFSPAEVAQHLHKSVKGVESEVCRTLYVYVKSLVGKSNSQVENWRNVTEWLEESGYKNKSERSVSPDGLLPDKSFIDIRNITIENKQIVFQFNLTIPRVGEVEVTTQDWNGYEM
ncbi:MAG: helix-turn-helix domain-containing protein [Roseofilum sp. SBFL]|uniref:hypothetical protein n=1 Tax=unclassified Roseofilum TaxID=2620099 RepID=UPI001B2CA78D|nr:MULTISPECIES: hypothetical protein [unclassified Roseofilum]MBP0014337.1 helix-turn-helix domain-containing protein [Roseofilum sp. SID3]MBP0024581.1 helix-turn-helix domain-containing protein [Roseofilum sp. SID2]MBP0037902.1 helix-turn-helix domain-containing protein [Roseofilum sp. SID1]MBP0040734.1 helix-turn-helix domain-containing protein [Roseofilum sp. SBFL]